MEGQDTIIFVLPYECRTKKNSLVIAGTGQRCPVCGKPRKQWVRQSASYNEFAEKAMYMLVGRCKEPIDYPCTVSTIFYMKTKRRVDLLNLEAAIHDILVDASILKDDNSNIVVSTDGSRVRYDAENPRVEITIRKITRRAG